MQEVIWCCSVVLVVLVASSCRRWCCSMNSGGVVLQVMVLLSGSVRTALQMREGRRKEAYARTHTHARTYARTHARTHTHTQTINKHTHTHSHTHTHTHHKTRPLYCEENRAKNNQTPKETGTGQGDSKTNIFTGRYDSQPKSGEPSHRKENGKRITKL